MGTILNKDREFLEDERKEMEQIASSDNDYPVLMINQNRYKEGEFLMEIFIWSGGQFTKKW